MRRVLYTVCLLLVVVFFAFYKKGNLEKMSSGQPNETDTAYTISATSTRQYKNHKMKDDKKAKENFVTNMGGAGNAGN